ncbi:hypothetical protein [Dongshaea marina]|uniref:hypothetical protein n=1 Tax=Dongshaea marina TaxID=2047966 RepID=UPI00131F1E2D|nr:hypothetical protein [Dongshaea marina]
MSKIIYLIFVGALVCFAAVLFLYHDQITDPNHQSLAHYAAPASHWTDIDNAPLPLQKERCGSML